MATETKVEATRKDGASVIVCDSTPEFHRWAGDLAASRRLSVAALVERALIELAERVGWREAPERLSSHRRAAR